MSGRGARLPGQGPIRTGVTVIVPHDGNIYQRRVSVGLACDAAAERALSETPSIAAGGFVILMVAECSDASLNDVHAVDLDELRHLTGQD